MPSSLAAAKNGYDVVLTHLQYTAPELLGTYPDLSPTTASDVSATAGCVASRTLLLPERIGVAPNTLPACAVPQSLGP